MREKYEALIRLYHNEDPVLIASDLGVTHARVLTWNRELKKAKDTDTVQQLLAMTTEQIEDMVNDAVLRLPDEIAESVNGLVAKVDGLNALSTELQSIASMLVQRLRAQTATASTPEDLHQITETICLIQKTFFATGTQINIQQNNAGGASEYGSFLSDKPGIIVNAEN